MEENKGRARAVVAMSRSTSSMSEEVLLEGAVDEMLVVFGILGILGIAGG